MNLTIINDTHIGAMRSGGTTPTTAYELRQWLLQQLEQVVEMSSSLLVLGDLFDTANVPMTDLLQTWQIFRNHVANGAPLVLVAGNHDLSKNSMQLSSFQFLCKLLQAEFGDRVTCVFEPQMLAHEGVYVIPHLPNQDLFNLALESVPACTYLLLHCNYDNGFATESDHSLNLSPEQAAKVPAKHIIIAHEHQASRRLEGKVIIPGNQFPSSVADCLGNDSKKLTLLQDDTFAFIGTWTASGSFSEQDWRELKDDGSQFIRVVGEASAAEASEVVTAISKFRSKSKALVITNAVQVAGVEDAAQIQVSLEEIKAFDVLTALLECLDPPEQEVIRQLLKTHKGV